MTASANATPLPFRLLSRLGVAVSALAVLYIQFSDPGINGFFAAKFGAMVNGVAFQPYVYRALLPWLVRLILAVVPVGAKAWIVSTVETPSLAQDLFRVFRWEKDLAAEYLVASLLMYACLLGFAWSMRRLLVTLYRAPPVAVEVVPIVAVLGLQTLFGYGSYIYDFPTLFLTTLSLLLLLERRWLPFVLTYALALFNKETAVLLAGVFMLHYFGRLPPRAYGALGLLLCALFAMSRIVLNQLYSGNFGAYTMLHLFDHNVALLHGYPPSSLVTVVFLGVLVFGHWREKPAFLKDALWMLLPLLGGCVMYGFLDELRDYYEVYPVIVLLMTPSVAALMGAPIATRVETQRRTPLREWVAALGTVSR